MDQNTIPNYKNTGTSGLMGHYATLIAVRGNGIMIEGRSGSGKTSLALGLIEYFKNCGEPACFVSDDQVLLKQEKSLNKPALLGMAPETIAGKAELFGFGIIEVDYIPQSRIDLIVIMTTDDSIERMPESFKETRCGLTVPAIKVPERHESLAVRLVCAKLDELRTES